ncbi:MAG: phage portal protein, partial [bacterium]
MPPFLRKTLRYLGLSRAPRRNYLAGRRTRLNRGWPTLQQSAQSAVYRDLRPMRARMRWLARNSDLFKKYLSLYRNNVA